MDAYEQEQADKSILAKIQTAGRLEELRAAIRSESISYGELTELQSLADQIALDDVELLQWAGVPEFCFTCGGYTHGGSCDTADPEEE